MHETRWLVERGDEFDTLEAELAEAKTGAGRVIHIQGPPGIGKTALLEATDEKAIALGFRTLTATGGELEQSLPYGIVHQLFRGVVSERAWAGGEKSTEGTLDAVRLALPFLGGTSEHGPGSTDRTGHALLYGLYWLLSDLTDEWATALLIDDAHWIDESSLRFLSFVGRRLDGLALAIIVSARDAEGGSVGESLRSELRVLGATEIRPKRLSLDGTRLVVEQSLGSSVTDEIVAACHRATRGNPLYLRELVRDIRDLAQPGAIGSDQIATMAPGPLSEFVSARLERLPAGAKALAEAVAVLGEQATLPRARALAGLALEEATLAADALVDTSIFEPGSSLRFVHPIVKSAVYSSLPEGRRSVNHVSAARLLASEGSRADTVGVQLLAAKPLGEPWIRDRLVDAARSASSDGAPAAAARFLRRALAESRTGSERADLLIALGAAESRAGDMAALGHLVEAADHATTMEARFRATLELGQVLAYTGRIGDAGAVTRRLLDELGDGQVELRRPLEMILLVLAETSVEGRRHARDLLANATRTVERLGKRAPPGLVAIVALERAFVDGKLEEAADLAQQALADGRLLGEDADDAPHALIAAAALTAADKMELVERHFESALSTARRRGSARSYAFASAMRAWSRLRFGRLKGAETDSRTALDLAADTRWPMFAPTAVGALARALLERDELSAAQQTIAHLDDETYGSDSVFFQPFFEARARLALAQGDPGAALRDLEVVAAWEQAWGAADGMWVSSKPATVLAHAAMGDTDIARRTAKEAVSTARQQSTSSSLGIALQAQASVSDRQAKVDLLRESVSLLEQSPNQLELARSQVLLGAEIRRHGRKKEARTPLKRGLDIAHHIGARAIERHAIDELRLAGARPRRLASHGPAALTPGELRVAETAARGLTNREVAQELFLTVKTVETHLSHVYLKLGISSRKDLPAALNPD